MRLLRIFAALLLGLPMAKPIPVAAEDAPLATEVQRRQRLLDGSCDLDQPWRLKRYGWLKTNSEPFLELGLRRGQRECWLLFPQR